MARRTEDAPLVVEVPPAGADRPSWARVGLITAVGFLVGVAWPRVAGIRLGPGVPEAPSALAVASASASGGVVEPVVPPAAPSAPPAAVVVASAPAQPPVVSPPPTVEGASGAHGHVAHPAGRAATAPGPAANQTEEAAAQVTWEVALIRDAPKTGKILARLPRGTSLRVAGAKDGWYPVKYGDGFANEGWVFRAAIGR